MTREIQEDLEELYRVEVSPTLISTITDAVPEDVRMWQSRPLEARLSDPLFSYILIACL
jgi:transposase-like protein